MNILVFDNVRQCFIIIKEKKNKTQAKDWADQAIILWGLGYEPVAERVLLQDNIFIDKICRQKVKVGRYFYN